MFPATSTTRPPRRGLTSSHAGTGVSRATWKPHNPGARWRTGWHMADSARGALRREGAVANPSAESDGWLGAWHLTPEQACQLAQAFGFEDSTPTDHVAPLAVLEDALREYRALIEVDGLARGLHSQNRKELGALGRSVRALQAKVARLSPEELRNVLLEGLGDALARPDLYRVLSFPKLQDELGALEAALGALKPPPKRPRRHALEALISHCAHRGAGFTALGRNANAGSRTRRTRSRRRGERSVLRRGLGRPPHRRH